MSDTHNYKMAKYMSKLYNTTDIHKGKIYQKKLDQYRTMKGGGNEPVKGDNPEGEKPKEEQPVADKPTVAQPIADKPAMAPVKDEKLAKLITKLTESKTKACSDAKMVKDQSKEIEKLQQQASKLGVDTEKCKTVELELGQTKEKKKEFDDFINKILELSEQECTIAE